jgi:hypothetical protein
MTDTIDKIQEVRSKNNGNWMDLLRIALKHSPVETKKVLSDINKRDSEISKLLSSLGNINNESNLKCVEKETTTDDQRIVEKYCNRGDHTKKEENYKLEFEIDFIPESLNTILRMNKYQRNDYNKLWYERVYLACLNKTPTTPLRSVRLYLSRYCYRMLDYDGVVGSLKVVVDGLIHANIIKDDNYSITGPWQVDQHFQSKKQGGKIWVKVEAR